MLNDASCSMMSAMSWRSKRQPTVALSSAEEEFISASAIAQKVMYFHKILANLSYLQSAPTPVFADNQTCIDWSEGSIGGSEHAKHIDLRFHFVLEARTAGHLELRKHDSKVNAADILTKASTPPDVFSDLRRRVTKRRCVSQKVESKLTHGASLRAIPLSLRRCDEDLYC